jgi:hypothetical protein
VAETADLTSPGRTSRRQRLVDASVDAPLRRCRSDCGLGPDRNGPAPRDGKLLAGDLRREGMYNSVGRGGALDARVYFTADASLVRFVLWAFVAILEAARHNERRFGYPIPLMR